MTRRELPNDICAAFKASAKFERYLIEASLKSPESGALAAISFATSMHELGVPLRQAFETVCEITGCQLGHLPLKIIERHEKPSDDANEVSKLNYRIVSMQNALALARDTLGFNKN